MEFKITAVNKAFVIVTILGPFLIVAMSVLPSLLTIRGSSSVSDIAITGGNEQFIQQIREPLALSKVNIVKTRGDVADLDAAVLEGEIKGYLILPQNPLEVSSLEYVSSGGTDFQLVGTLQGIIGHTIIAHRLVAAGIDPAQVNALTQQPGIEAKKISKKGGKERQDFMTNLFTGLAFTFLLYMTVLLYGQAIGRSVLTEKTSKTVEIVLSAVHPRDLLFGKLLGKASAGILQYAVWIVMAVIFLNILSPLIGVKVPLAGGPSTFVFLVIFFLLAFFLYSAIYAALGAASEDEQHLGQLSIPIIFFLVIPMVAIGAIIASPGSPIIIFFSYFPLTASIVMFQRIVISEPEIEGILLCIGIQLISIGCVILLSAKIFRVGILMTGKRFKLNEILRWIRYK